MMPMDVSPTPPDLEALAALLEPNRRRLYQYVERQRRAVSRDEAAEAIGVSRALAAFHLDKLVGLGLLRPEFHRLSGRTGPGAGRTSKLYRRSRHQFAVSLPQRDHELLARLLADSFDSAATTDPNVEPARDYGRSLGRRARKGMRGRAGVAQLTACVEAVLATLGFEPYRPTPVEIRLRNCPFDPLARLYTPLVCGIGQAMVSGIVQGVGADGLQVSRDEDPDRCCGIVRSVS
jgi:predicted ArsR family transcriptional regulator